MGAPGARRQGDAARAHRHRPDLLLPGQSLEHRRRGAVRHGRRPRRLAGAAHARQRRGTVGLAGHDASRHRRRRALWIDPGPVEGALRGQRDPDQPDARLCGAARARLPHPRAVARPQGHELPAIGDLRPRRHPAAALRRRAAACRSAVRARRDPGDGLRPRPHALRLSPARHRRGAARGALRRLRREPHDPCRLRDLGRPRRPCRHERGRGPDRPAAALDLAGLRLHRDHGGLSRPPQPVRHPRRLARRGADLHRRRERADPAQAAARSDDGVPGPAPALRPRRRRARQLPAADRRRGEGGGHLSRRERSRRR